MSFFKSNSQILLDLGIEKPEQIDVEAIAFHLGAIVKYRPLDNCAARIIGYGDKAIISVDPNCSGGRKRFSVGHEIGHWINDRGKGMHLCTSSTISDSNAQDIANSSERVANQFSSDLLLPEFMLLPKLEKRDMTLVTIKDIAEEFQVSVTAAAIKSVKTSKYPAMLVSFKKTGGRWFVKGPKVPDEIWPAKELHHDSLAFNVLYGKEKGEAGPSLVRADCWITHRDSHRYRIMEHSKKITDDMVISLLWWKNQSQLQEVTK